MKTTTIDSTFTRLLRLGFSFLSFNRYRKNRELNKAKEQQKQYLTSEKIHHKIVTGSRVSPPHQDHQDNHTHI